MPFCAIHNIGILRLHVYVIHLHVIAKGGTIHRCIDISRYFSRDTYRDIMIFFFFFFAK